MIILVNVGFNSREAKPPMIMADCKRGLAFYLRDIFGSPIKKSNLYFRLFYLQLSSYDHFVYKSKYNQHYVQ